MINQCRVLSILYVHTGSRFSDEDSINVTFMFSFFDKADSSGKGVGNGGQKFDGVFTSDRRWLACSAAMMLFFYWTVRRCASLVDDWSCSDATSCSSDVEWIVSTASAAQAMVSVATAAVYRRSSTAHLLNYAYYVLSRNGNKRVIGGRLPQRQRAFTVTGAFATVAMVVVLVRSMAVMVARPNRFSIIDVLLLCLPAATVPIIIECSIVCVCSSAEDTCCDVIQRLQNIALDAARPPATNRLCGRQPLHWQLEAAWRDHWRSCQLIDCLSTCYGLDLAVNLTTSMLFFVVYAYVTLISVYTSYVANDNNGTTANDNYNGIMFWNIALACQLSCVSFRIVFISYRAEKIKQVVLTYLHTYVKNNVVTSQCHDIYFNLAVALNTDTALHLYNFLYHFQKSILLMIHI